MPKPSSLLKTILNNNLVTLIPIIVALVYVIGNNSTTKYRMDKLEASRPESKQLEELTSKVNNFISVQERINDVLLNFVSKRGHASYRELSAVKRDEVYAAEKVNDPTKQVDQVYGDQANKLLQTIKEQKTEEAKK